MKKLYISLILVTIFAISSIARDGDSGVENNGFFAFNYSMGTTFGSSNEFIGEPSFRGFNFDYRRKLNPNVSAGILLGYQHFYEKLDRDLYQAPNNPGVTISSVQSRLLSVIPVTIQGHYYFVNDSRFEPYLGFGIGVYKLEYEKWWGAAEDANDEWKLGMNGQIGTTFAITPDYFGINLGLVYHWVPSYEYNEIDGVTFLNLNLGLYLNF